MKSSVIFIILILILFLLLLIFSKRVVYFITLIRNKFKKCNIKELNPKDIDRDILVNLSELEKTLYSKGFTRRVIIEVKQDATLSYYKFYYYNLIEGVHAYIKYLPNCKCNKFYTYFETIYDNKKSVISSNYETFIPNAIPDDIYFFKHENLKIEELYDKHLQDRKVKSFSVYRNRLHINNLINLEQFRSSEYLAKLAQRGYLKYTDFGYKLSPTFNLFKDSINLHNSIFLQKSKYIPTTNIAIISIIALLTTSLYFKMNQTEPIKVEPIKPITNINSELKHFNEKIKSYKGLTLKLNIKDKYTLKNAFYDLDKYLEASNINRYIAPAFNGKITTYAKCKLPNGLKQVLKWHNGIESIVPGRDLLNYSKVQNSIKKSNNFIYTVTPKDANTGLAFNCNRKGLFEYNLENKIYGKKEFYDIEHFIKVTAMAYNNGAFFDSNGIVNIDMKKYISLYRSTLSSPDKKRYSSLVKYLKRRANIYNTSSSKKLKLRVLNEISKTFDPTLIDSAKLYLNDSNRDVRVAAISALGDIGDRSVIKYLTKFLNSKDKKSIDFTLMALAKVATKDDTSLLKKIYPILDNSSILVRISAYRVIAKIGSKEALKVITKRFKKEDSAAKLEIIKILSKVGTIDELLLLKDYLQKINLMDFNQNDIIRPRGIEPHPKVLKYETINAINSIEQRPFTNPIHTAIKP